jgi:hypothetical protein
MAEEKVFVFLSSEIQELLADNRIELTDELAVQGIAVVKGYAPNPAADPGDKTRSAALVILASGISISVISAGIVKIIDALGRNKKVVGKEVRCVPALDGNGNVIRDKDGNVVMQWEEATKLVEASRSVQGVDTIKGTASLGGLTFEMTSGK